MKLNAQQLKKIIAEEVAAARRGRLTEAQSLDAARMDAVRHLTAARSALALLFEETDNPDYMSAANDAEALLEFIEGIVDEAVV